MKHSGQIFRRLAQATDLQEEPIPGQPLVEISGNTRVLIEHHRGVTEYGCGRIGVKVKFGTLCVTGKGLELAQMTAQKLVITGCIDGVILERRKV